MTEAAITRHLQLLRASLRSKLHDEVVRRGVRWWRTPLQFLRLQIEGRFWIEVNVQLESFRWQALHATDEAARVAAIDSANTFFHSLEMRGYLKPVERISCACDWVKAYARDRVSALFNNHDSLGVARMTKFLKQG